jgi:uncharacterized protein YkwD
MPKKMNRLAKSITATALTVVVSFGVVAPAHAAVSAPVTATSTISTQSASELVKQKAQILEFEQLINSFRAEHGMDPVRFNSIAASEAYGWSKHMGDTGEFRHMTSAEMDKSLAGNYKSRGEIVAYNYSSNYASSMFTQWKNSRGHRNIMLDPYLTSFGTGFYTKDNRTYGTTIMHRAKDDNMVSTYQSAADYFNGKAQLPLVDTSLTRVLPASVRYDQSTGKVTIPNSVGVRYYLKDQNVFLPAGEHIFPSSVDLRAVPQPGYGFDQYGVFNWYFFKDKPAGVTTVVPAMPSFTTEGVTITATANVDYYIDGTKVDAGFHPVSKAGTVNVTAKPASSTVYLDNYYGGWTKVYGVNAVSNPKTVSVNPTAKTYTVPSVTGLTYSINGKITPAGTYSAKVGDTIKVVTNVAPGYGIDNLASFNYNYTFPSGATTPVEPTITKVTPKPVVFNKREMTYTVPDTTGVFYMVNGIVHRPGVYSAQRNELVSVLAGAYTGYELIGDTSWLGDFTATEVQPAAPSFDKTGYKLTIPKSVNGVSYLLDGKPVAAGTHTIPEKTTVSVKAVLSTAALDQGFALVGNTSWESTYPAKPVVLTSVTASVPSFNTTARSYTIPAKTGVSYKVNGVTKAAGTYTVSDAKQTIAVTAHAATGYKLSGAASWTQDYAAKPKPLTSVTASAPSFNTTARTYTIPTKTGVSYKVNGVVKAAGTHKVSDAKQTLTVTAHAATGYTLSGTSTWSKAYAVKPLTVVATASPSFNTTARSYTIPKKTGISYKVNGAVKAAGTHKLSNTKQTITVTAHPATGYKLSGTSTWSKAYAAKPLTVVKTSSPVFNTKTRSYTIPAKTGVTYKVNNVAKKKGTFKVSNVKQTVKVTAHAVTGYKLSGTVSWSKAYPKK